MATAKFGQLTIPDRFRYDILVLCFFKIVFQQQYPIS